jgi:putative membrane protein
MQDITPTTEKPQRHSGPADHLANERTFLAWIRTSIALMGFGFVIVKFSLFIHQISVAFGENAVLPDKGYSATIGVIMVALGALWQRLRFCGTATSKSNSMPIHISHRSGCPS